MCINELVTTWDLYIKAAVWATRIRKHATTGYSPYYLVYGRYPPMPLEDVGNIEETKTDLNKLITRIAKVRIARSLAIEQLLARAIRAEL